MSSILLSAPKTYIKNPIHLVLLYLLFRSRLVQDLSCPTITLLYPFWSSRVKIHLGRVCLRIQPLGPLMNFEKKIPSICQDVLDNPVQVSYILYSLFLYLFMTLILSNYKLDLLLKGETGFIRFCQSQPSWSWLGKCCNCELMLTTLEI